MIDFGMVTYYNRKENDFNVLDITSFLFLLINPLLWSFSTKESAAPLRPNGSIWSYLSVIGVLHPKYIGY